MNVKVEFLKFKSWLNEHRQDYQKILSEKPYCIEIKTDNMFGENLVLFKYNQIESDFGQPFVKLCRGLVLNANTFEPIAFPFVKFHNVGEIYADEIDAKSMKSTTKIDGSIVKIVKLSNNLLIGTNSNINAHNAPVAEQIGCKYKSFGEIIEDILKDKFGDIDNFKNYLHEGYTYIFELVSPWTRVVTPYPKNDLYLIGCRNNITFDEIFFKDCSLAKYFSTPEIFDFSSIQKCFEYAQTLDWTNEGFVVMDKYFNRVKVKNAVWLSVHHLANNGVMSYERAIDIVKANEIDEVVNYFPEFKKSIDDVKIKYENLIERLESSWNRFKSFVTPTTSRKDAAIWIQKNFDVPGVGFSLLDNKISTVKEWIENYPSNKLVKILSLKDN